MYKLEMKVKNEHIDFQGILDGLYYPFYMEECRHKYVKDVIGVDIQEFAKAGLNLVLLEYSLKFKSSLKKEDVVEVTCTMAPTDSKIKFAFDQTIICNGKIVSEGKFFATCVKADGGRPYIPDEIKKYLDAQHCLE